MAFNILIAITQDCNLKCYFCPVIKRKSSLDLERLIEFIDLIRALSNGREYILLKFQGGEPLLYWGKIKKIIDHFKQDSVFKFSITSNGRLLNDDIIGTLINSKTDLVLSLDDQKWNFNRDVGRLVSIFRRYRERNCLNHLLCWIR